MEHSTNQINKPGDSQRESIAYIVQLFGTKTHEELNRMAGVSHVWWREREGRAHQ